MIAVDGRLMVLDSVSFDVGERECVGNAYPQPIS